MLDALLAGWSDSFAMRSGSWSSGVSRTRCAAFRASIDTELMVSGIGPVQGQHQRIAVELTKLAEKRRAELLRS